MILLAATLALTATALLADDFPFPNHSPGLAREALAGVGEVDARHVMSGDSTVRAETAVRSPLAEHCPHVQHAIGWYRRAYTATRERMGLAGAPPRAWYPCDTARRRAAEWRDRAKAARQELAAWIRDQYQWWRWMPRGSKWYRVASCETGYGRDPNWAHDSGTYVSAFGIYRPGYADDAHRIGNLSWDETRRRLGRIPTPREQYDAALSHYRAHGGFSGWGCRGA